MLRQKDSPTIQHGLDIAICKIDKLSETLTFAGAKRPVIYFNNGSLEEIKGSKNPIGDSHIENKVFEEHGLKIKKGDVFYIFSDGFADQFGETSNKKYMIKNFKTLLSKIHRAPLKEQEVMLEKEMKEWIGSAEQTDDMLILGFRI